jgi:hypothetical protein
VPPDLVLISSPAATTMATIGSKSCWPLLRPLCSA